jgi:exodeoxyribonuclease-5
MIELSPDQKIIHDAAVTFVKEKKGGPHLRIGGYAGTGKSTVTAQIALTLKAEEKNPRIAFCCYTGKAAYVLREKLTAAKVVSEEDEYVGTIHGLMYRPIVKDDVIVGWRRADKIEADLIVVDEASMVDEIIWKDLLSYKIPIIAVGDHGQLPPVGRRFGLMEKPDYALEKIHRQAEGNPIIKASIAARMEGKVPVGQETTQDMGGIGVYKIVSPIGPALDLIKNLPGTLFLCGYNRTRVALNNAIRKRLGHEGKPREGERVICLKNNRELGIFNGMGGTLKSIKEQKGHWYGLNVLMDDGATFAGDVIKKQFGAEQTIREMQGLEQNEIRELFDFGYCLTVHKAQGSEADAVVVFEERFPMMTEDDWKRWLYTAVTRARKKLLIVGRS